MKRICKTCLDPKELSEFSPNGNGHKTSCKKCRNKAAQDKWIIDHSVKPVDLVWWPALNN